jgi:N-acetylneuraminic acid mutarotase
MIVWGGWNGTIHLNTGGRYNPSSNSWTAVTTAGVPSARFIHTAVWTGTEMIVWGGANSGTGFLNSGGLYNPASDSWTVVATNGTPAVRGYHTAVWAGSEMIIWGGYYYDGLPHYFNDGGRYDPTSNSWTTVTTAGAPAARASHTAVWTGSGMIVWGGENGSYFNDTFTYAPQRAMYLYQRP